MIKYQQTRNTRREARTLVGRFKAGKLAPGQGLVRVRPFRAPHHTVSEVALVGGGLHPLPGEVSLAHRGVLFLDELPEFRRHVLEPLRQPLEERRITVARGAGAVAFPAAFQLNRLSVSFF